MNLAMNNQLIGLGSAARIVLVLALMFLMTASPSFAAVTFTTQHGANVNDFDAMISNSDLIQGKATLDVDVYENPMDSFGMAPLPGWHPANTNPADQIAAFTDGAGMLASGLTGLLNDNFPVETASGRPAKIVEYPFTSPVNIGQINILTGNRNNADGRIFSTTYIEYSTNNGFTYQPLGYFQSDPSGTLNNETSVPLEQRLKSTFVRIFDNGNSTMLSGVTNIIFNFYSVDNTGGQMRDPYDGVNTITGLDDGLTAAFVSPLVLEIDVLPPSERLLGDYNLDNKVDAADYVVWRKTGIDGQLGYDNWRANFGASQGAGSVSAVGVPEPNTFVMLVLGASLALARRRRARF